MSATSRPLRNAGLRVMVSRMRTTSRPSSSTVTAWFGTASIISETRRRRARTTLPITFRRPLASPHLASNRPIAGRRTRVGEQLRFVELYFERRLPTGGVLPSGRWRRPPARGSVRADAWRHLFRSGELQPSAAARRLSRAPRSQPEDLVAATGWTRAVRQRFCWPYAVMPLEASVITVHKGRCGLTVLREVGAGRGHRLRHRGEGFSCSPS